MHESTYIKTKVAKQACMLASSGFLSISFTPVNTGGLSSEGVGGLAARAGPINRFELRQSTSSFPVLALTKPPPLPISAQP
jgi:hypothetical protein